MARLTGSGAATGTTSAEALKLMVDPAPSVMSRISVMLNGVVRADTPTVLLLAPDPGVVIAALMVGVMIPPVQSF